MTKVKFDPATIGKLFEMFNSDNAIKRIDIAKGGSRLQPIVVDKTFEDPASIKAMLLPGKRANAFAVISAGHVYDDFGKSKVKTMEERAAIAKTSAEKLVSRMN